LLGIEYRTDTETKERLTDFSEQNGRKVSDVINEAVHQYLNSQQPDEASEVSVTGLEKQLRRYEDKYTKRSNEKDLAGMKGDEAYYFAAILVDEPYKALNGDWQKIRFQALQDFHSDSPPRMGSRVGHQIGASDYRGLSTCRGPERTQD
jgi:hypothetical protein